MAKYGTNDFYGKPMTDTIMRTGYNYTPDHRTYGGELTQFDFEGHHTMATMSKSILKSWGIDKMCALLCREHRPRGNKNG
jgi:hypothetical protein